MIVPSDHCGIKDYQHINGLDLGLDKFQRIRLWEDDILGRFAWLWPGTYDDSYNFTDRVQDLAGEHGFTITFAHLQGGDHSLQDYRGEFDLITSDITRPVDILQGGWNETGKPDQIETWNEWKRTQPVPDRVKIKHSFHCLSPPCWICWKVKHIFPEHFKKGSKEGKRDHMWDKERY